MKVLPWVRSIMEKMNYIFQQDSAPVHMAKFVKEWLELNMNFWLIDFGHCSCLTSIQLTSVYGYMSRVMPAWPTTATLMS